MRFILLGNYLPDRQESMERFAQMLHTGLQKAGIATEIWRPVPLVGAYSGNTTVGLGKWLGYIDKWLLFPVILRWRIWQRALTGPDVYFHICDHANSPYLGHINQQQTGVTCHDVLAIRSSLGLADTYVEVSRFGKLLQRWIYSHLHRAERLASVSELTLQQLVALGAPALTARPAGWRVIHNAFNAPFVPLSSTECTTVLQRAGLALPAVFILHVGSDHPRKNRGMLLKMVHELGSRWDGSVCFAGDGLDEVLLAQAHSLGLQERVISIVKPNHETLVALYSACEAFIFPSYSEGFGWPVIEAQACGTPVIASSVAPMPEVSGGAALHADPDDPAAFAAALLALQQPEARAELIQRGFRNCRRFEPAHMTQAYLQLYNAVSASPYEHAA